MPDVDAHEFSNVAKLGYESILVVENLETLYIFILLYIAGLITVGIVRLASKGKPYKALAKFLFWNLLFRFYIESYLELAIACFIFFRNAEQS
jgi:hypothetical protein